MAKTGRRGVWAVVAALALSIGWSAWAVAQETRLGGKLRGGRTVVVPTDETVSGDLYVSGGMVRIEGRVDGDLVVMGGQVQVPGEVGGDALIGGGNVEISGSVEGDARIGAGAVTVSGAIGEDLLTGAGQVILGSGAEVGEDFIFGAGQTSLDGRVTGDVLGSTGEYRKTGTIGGTEDVTVGRRELTPLDRVLRGLQRFVAVLAVGALLLWLLPTVFQGAADTLRRRPLASFGVGLVGFVGFVVLVAVLILAAVLLCVALGLARLDDLVGIVVFGTSATIGVLGFVFFVVAAFGAQAAVGLVLGRLALGTERTRRWIALVLGVLVVVVVSVLPVVGGWLAFVIAAFGLGAAILELWPWRRRAPEAA